MDRDRLVGETAYEHRLVANLPSMLAYWDANLRCRFANQAYRHWFGVDPNSLVGTSLRDLLGPELFALNEPHIRAVLSGQEQLFERSVPGPGGVTRESLANYVPDIVEGTVVGFLVQVMDITKVKATHDALKEAEEYLRQLFELSHEGILVADEAGRYTDVNDSCCHMLGYARTEIIGKTFEDLLAPSELHRLPTARAEMLAGGVHVQEWMLLRRDGTALPVEVRARRLSDGRRVGLLLDITDHKRILAAERATAMQLEETVA
jgi:PAS domain S-box-containing protein